MLDTLLWQRALHSPEAKEQLAELQTNTLRILLVLTGTGYALWHYATSLVWVTLQSLNQAYSILPAVVVVLLGTYWLLPRSERVAKQFFVVSSLLAITWALFISGNHQVVMLFPMVALVAAFLVHPLGGLVVTFVVAGGLELVGRSRPDLMGEPSGWYVVLFAGLAVLGIWVVMQNLILALNWYAQSYDNAERRTREAEEHRAELMRAWKQLDISYYRVERAKAALQVAWKAADEAERSKMELATNISHELRTPLNLIVGYSDMMMTSPGSYGGVALPHAYRRDLYSIYCAGQHLLALTDDVLDLARMEVGKMGLSREPVDVVQVIRDVTTLVNDYVGSKGLDLRLNVQDTIPALMLDRLRIRQVLLNLITNAARFTQKGYIEILVCSRENDILVSVADTGPGIHPDELPRVFNEFTTQGKTDSAGHYGTGLGLPISKRFVELHGGEMGAESTLGLGTTFWFTLPVRPGDVTSPIPSSGSLSSAYRQQVQQVLMLARSDDRLAHLLQRHLDDYYVVPADGIVAAQTRASELKASAIVADLDTVLDTVIGEQSSPIPVIRCPLPSLHRTAQRLGANAYLTKPVTREALMGAIKNLDRPIVSVLIADDDPDFTRLLSQILRSGDDGYRISIANNGEEALARMIAEPPDLLLLDLSMPVLDGAGVLERMGTQQDLRKVSTVVISAHGEEDSVSSLGSEMYISKPEGFRLAEMIQLIGAVVKEMAPVRAHLASTGPVPPAEQLD